MENKKNLSTGAIVALIVIAVFNILSFVCNFIMFRGHMSFSFWVAIFEFIIAAFYAIYGFKKPHGNHMRHLLLIYAVIDAVLLLLSCTNQPTYVNAVYLIIIILAVYMAGRLHKYTQNIIISIAVLVCDGIVAYYLIDMIAGFGIPLTFVNFCACLGGVACWLAIAAGYVFRYREHKEAGLTDK